MRLRDSCALGGTVLALFAVAGCHRGNAQIVYPNNEPVPHIKATENTPKMQAQTQVALAQEYMQDGQNDVALDDLQKAIKLDPSSSDAYTMLGVLDEKLNRLTEADAAYAKSVKLAPNNGNVLNNYGAWLCRSGHPLEADAQFRKALADPFYKTPAMAISNAAYCAYKSGKLDVAEGYDRQLLAANPNDVDALQSMAAIEFAHADYMRARGFAERALAGKSSPDSLDLAARIEEKLGDQDAARAYRQRLSSEFPQFVPHQ